MKKYTLIIESSAECDAIDRVCMDAIHDVLDNLPNGKNTILTFIHGSADATLEPLAEAPRGSSRCEIDGDETRLVDKPAEAPRLDVKEGPACVPCRDYTEVEGTLKFHFGKNGGGLSDELLKIGRLINDLSQHNYIVLQKAFVDPADDVYDLTFYSSPKE